MVFWIILALLALYAIMSQFRQKPKPSDPYGDFHLVLNRTGADVSSHSTEWLNMGYWKVNNASLAPIALYNPAYRPRTASQRRVKVITAPATHTNIFSDLFLALALFLYRSSGIKEHDRVLGQRNIAVFSIHN